MKVCVNGLLVGYQDSAFDQLGFGLGVHEMVIDGVPILFSFFLMEYLCAFIRAIVEINSSRYSIDKIFL
jgi:hypothetical protein